MTKRVGIREVTRNFSILDGYDYIEIEDKKTHQLKGVFISSEFLDEVKDYIEKKIEEKKRKKISKIMQYAGSVEIDDRFKDKDIKEIKKMIAMDKYDK